jgi:hypothetical protein
MRMTRTRWALVAGAGTVVAVGLAIAAPGGVDRYDGTRAGAPAWSKPCWKTEPRQDRELLARCARVSGRVLWVRRQGFGTKSKAEMVVAARFGLVMSKMAPYAGRDVPGIGTYVHIVGPLVKSKVGLREVEFFAQQ